jgi:hypothetical protein
MRTKVSGKVIGPLRMICPVCCELEEKCGARRQDGFLIHPHPDAKPEPQTLSRDKLTP